MTCKSLIISVAVASALSAAAQSIVVYPVSGDPITYKMADISHIEFLPATDEPDTPEQEVAVTELYCHKGDSQIYGKLYRPAAVAATEALPTVILAHSASLTADAMDAYATALAADGYCAYAFDFCGGSDDSRSDGATADMTVFTEVDDLKAVIAELKTNAGVDGSKVFVLGSSQGGLVAALTAEDTQTELAGLILFYPAFNIPDLIALMDQYGGFGTGGTGMGGMMSYSEAFCDAMRGYDVYANIGGFARPVIIVHGSNDFIVKISYSEKAVETYPDATLYTIEGANHGFNADNLGSYGSLLGGAADYDAQVIPIVLNYMHAQAPLAAE